MSILVGKDGKPLLSEVAREEAVRNLKDAELRSKIFRLHADVSALVQQVVTLSMISAGIEEMETINATSILSNIMLELSTDDPTGSTITVNQDWYNQFKQDIESAFSVVEDVLKQRMEQEQAEDSAPY